uniref:Uncharacterized protein n=1 Tax=Arundo donax TaxID=35708 RepID=A0A0A9H861_ARUDO
MSPPRRRPIATTHGARGCSGLAPARLGTHVAACEAVQSPSSQALAIDSELDDDDPHF